MHSIIAVLLSLLIVGLSHRFWRRCVTIRLVKIVVVVVWSEVVVVVVIASAVINSSIIAGTCRRGC